MTELNLDVMEHIMNMVDRDSLPNCAAASVQMNALCRPFIFKEVVIISRLPGSEEQIEGLLKISNSVVPLIKSLKLHLLPGATRNPLLKQLLLRIANEGRLKSMVLTAYCVAVDVALRGLLSVSSLQHLTLKGIHQVPHGVLVGLRQLRDFAVERCTFAYNLPDETEFNFEENYPVPGIYGFNRDATLDSNGMLKAEHLVMTLENASGVRALAKAMTHWGDSLKVLNL